MKNRLKSITTIPFLACLALLLLNDFYLKIEYHNWLTGKLSDFCGLFVFTWFWTALFPQKKRSIYFSTALLFIVWKSQYSQFFIDIFSHNLYSINRVIDITDLIALVVLPISYLYNQESIITLKLNPILLAVLAIFSFCATSIPPATQEFEQPQYLLLKSDSANFKNSSSPWDNYKVHTIDSLIVVEINEIQIDNTASLYDEFHKVQILKDLDLYFLRIAKGDSYKELFHFRQLRDSLTFDGATDITLTLDDYKDSIHFNDSRLNGKFWRLSHTNQLLIRGKYKKGIEDSIWTFYNEYNEVISKKHFTNGELVKVENIENEMLTHEENYTTRDEKIRNKYFHLAIILLLIIGILNRLFVNYKKSSEKDVIRFSNLSLILGIMILPVIVFLIARLISTIIPNPFSTYFFSIGAEGFIIYIIVAILSQFIYFVLKLRNKFDILLYILFFSLTVVFIKELIRLINITY